MVCHASGQAGRPSFLPAAMSKLPGPPKGRVSTYGDKGSTAIQPLTMGLPGNVNITKKISSDCGNVDARGNSDKGNNSGSGILGLTEEEIDERVSGFFGHQSPSNCATSNIRICRRLPGPWRSRSLVASKSASAAERRKKGRKLRNNC